MSGSTPRVLAKEDYTVGWICAITEEIAAAKGMLDEFHEFPGQDAADHNAYTLGRIQDHNVVIASLPAGISGTTTAATVAKDMLRTFKSIRFGLMVGIGGGAPSPEHDIRLGDIVVSQPSGTSGGVIQYDRGKALKDGFELTGSLNAPPKVILTALTVLRADHSVGCTRIPDFLSNFMQKYPKAQKRYGYPGRSKDCLFTTEYQHEAGSTSTCTRCDPARLVQRETRDDAGPVVHYGNIASGNQVVKDAMFRDRLQKKYDVLCFEMEAAGLMLEFPCIVIRGISDYADSHKNDTWQGYAAVTAAAFAKELLQGISPAQVEREKAVPQLVSDRELHERVSSVKESIRDEAREKEAREEQKKRNACHQVFKTSSYESFKNTNDERVPGTCLWVLDHPQYEGWLSSSYDDLLWISADPGCGKSVLARSLVENELRNTSERTVCYFFFKDSAGQISLADCLCALLHQLFHRQPLLIKHAMVSYKINGEKLQHEVGELWRILLAAVKDKQARAVTCVLDALDECSENDRQQLIRLLTRFYSVRRRSSGNARLKFLVTSRAYGDIEDGFNDIPPELPSIRLAGEHSNTDISREINLVIQQRVLYVAHVLRLDQHTQDALLEKLRATPHRTYLWLHLVIEEILQSSKRTEMALINTISTLPETVEEAYENILKKSDKKHGKLARILLHIVVAARRPLTLSEMDTAFQLATDCPSAQNQKDVDLDKDKLVSRLRKLCGLFIFFADERVYLIHQTAKEFLIAKSSNSCSVGNGWKNSIDERLANKIMTQICVQYLSFGDVESMFARFGSVWKRELHQSGTEYPFLRYSYTYWPVHVSSAGVVNDELLDQITRVLYDDKHPRFRSLFGLRDWRLYPESHRFNGIHLAALHGHHEILDRLLREPRQDLDAEDDDGKTALMVASYRGYDKIVERLVVAGANVNKQHETKDLIVRTALQAAIDADCTSTVHLLLALGAVITRGDITIAISRDHYDFTKLLIDKGADINAETTEGLTPLTEASARDFDTIVQLLIEAGANINARFGCSENPLVAACLRGHETIARLLISKGAKINPPNGESRSALGAAARRGHLAIVRLLLEKEAEVNFADSDGSTPLWEASKDDDVFCMLLEHGANMNAPSLSSRKKVEVLRAALKNKCFIKSEYQMDIPDKDGRTPLYAASGIGFIEVIKFLLDRRASPTTAADDGQTPVHKAAQCGPVEALRLFHKHGAALDIVDKGGMAPIHVASYFRHLEAVSFLLDHGVDANITDNTRRTPLHAASWKGNVEVVRLLLQRGANINSVDDVQRTPLYTAASKGHVDVVSILLENGADPGIKTLKNNTPLESAQHHGYELVAEALLRHSEVLNKQDSEADTTVVLGGDSEQPDT